MSEFQYSLIAVLMQKLKWTVLIRFNFGFKRETEMDDSQDGPLQLISVGIIFDIHRRIIFVVFPGISLISRF